MLRAYTGVAYMYACMREHPHINFGKKKPTINPKPENTHTHTQTRKTKSTSFYR